MLLTGVFKKLLQNKSPRKNHPGLLINVVSDTFNLGRGFLAVVINTSNAETLYLDPPSIEPRPSSRGNKKYDGDIWQDYLPSIEPPPFTANVYPKK